MRKKEIFVALTAVVGHTSIAWDQKTFHFPGECGFGIALWSLWGSFSLWPFWMYAQFTAKTLREGKESALTLALQYSWVIWSTSVTVESEESSNNKLEQTS